MIYFHERNPGQGSGKGNSQGFTLIELLMVVVIISILAALAQPNFHRAIVKARAVDVVADLNVIKNGVMAYQAEHSQWPPDRGRGTIPPGLSEFLPEGFSFRNPEFVLDYDNWSGRGSSPFDVGLTYISTDPELGQAVMAMLGSNVWSDGRTKFTWVIE